jgi:tRNA-modifying protein YgfZ
MVYSRSVTPLKHSLIKMSGASPHAFLQGQWTTQATQLTDTTWQPGLICDRKGRIIASLWARKSSQDPEQTLWLLLHDHASAQCLCDYLKPYALVSRITLTPTDQTVWLTYPDLSEPKNHMTSANSLYLPHHTKHHPAEEASMPPYALLNEAAAKSMHATQNETSDWQHHLIQAAIPWVDHQNSGQFTPHQLGLAQTGWVDFAKGCFVGQEILAKVQHFGKTRRQLYRLEGQAALAPKQEIRDDKENKRLGLWINFFHKTATKDVVGLALLDKPLEAKSLSCEEGTYTATAVSFA